MLPLRHLNSTQLMLVTQLILIGIVAIAISMLKAGERRVSRIFGSDHLTDGMAPVVVLLALTTIGLLLFTLGSPILSAMTLHRVGLPTINPPLAFFLVSVLNMLVATWLVAKTGGYGASPFGVVLFVLPVLAMFLSLPAPGFVVYACIAGLLLVLLARVDPGAIGHNPHHKGAYTFVNTACLALVAAVGYVTRV